MTNIVTVDPPNRGRVTPAQMTAFVAVECTDIRWAEDGEHIEIVFAADLTDAQAARVVRRWDALNDVDAALRDQAEQALAAMRDYLALQSPTAAQVAAQVRLLTRTLIAVVRMVLRRLDDTG